tara:strand:+ start:2846 stop:3283 length:438 start_codon:yes stop_codon:yes gene_type:complete
MKYKHQASKRLTVASSFLTLILGFGLSMSAQAEENDKVFELRTYTSAPGKLDDLQSRFRDHTTRIFAKHGMKVIAYWTPTDPEKASDTLIYVLEHESQVAADQSWQAFAEDPEWAAVSEASNANGRILAKVVREYMKATDYSPLR